MSYAFACAAGMCSLHDTHPTRYGAGSEHQTVVEPDNSDRIAGMDTTEYAILAVQTAVSCDYDKGICPGIALRAACRKTATTTYGRCDECKRPRIPHQARTCRSFTARGREFRSENEER